jgi:hypothetical protein
MLQKGKEYTLVDGHTFTTGTADIGITPPAGSAALEVVSGCERSSVKPGGTVILTITPGEEFFFSNPEGVRLTLEKFIGGTFKCTHFAAFQAV